MNWDLNRCYDYTVGQRRKAASSNFLSWLNTLDFVAITFYLSYHALAQLATGHPGSDSVQRGAECDGDRGAARSLRAGMGRAAGSVGNKRTCPAFFPKKLAAQNRMGG